MSEIPLVPGIEIQLGGRTLTLAPLNFAALETLMPQITGWTGGVDDASRSTVVDCVLASLKRNYPDITREFVLEYLDVANMLDIMAAVMDVGGLKRKGIEAGKAVAVRANGSIGASSTAIS